MSETANFEDWVLVSYNDDTGLGRMAADFKSVLGIRRHIAIPSDRLTNHPLHTPWEVELQPEDSESKVLQVLADVKVLLFFERPGWHPQLLRLAKEQGIFTVCVPMWEWFRPDSPEWKWCDLFVCPNQFCQQVLQKLGFNNTCVLPPVVNLSSLPERRVEGEARLFIHNAGLVDFDDRKSTLDVVRAFERVKMSDVRLEVRMQKKVDWVDQIKDERISVSIGNKVSPAQLYLHGDVAIQPSKMEGIGFMVLEPVCCGLPVLTLDYGPMNEWVQQPSMRVRPQWRKRRAFASQWMKHAHLRLPNRRDLTRHIEWCAQNDVSEISRQNRAWAEKTFNSQKLRDEWMQIIRGF